MLDVKDDWLWSIRKCLIILPRLYCYALLTDSIFSLNPLSKLSIFTLESHRFHAWEPPRWRIFSMENNEAEPQVITPYHSRPSPNLHSLRRFSIEWRGISTADIVAEKWSISFLPWIWPLHCVFMKLTTEKPPSKNWCNVSVYCTKGGTPNILLRHTAKNIINPAHTM